MPLFDYLVLPIQYTPRILHNLSDLSISTSDLSKSKNDRLPTESDESHCKDQESGSKAKVRSSANILSDGREVDVSSKNRKNDHTEASAESVNAVTMLLQRIAAARSSNAPSSCSGDEHNLSKEVSIYFIDCFISIVIEA